MILVALIKAFQNHIGFAIIRVSGEEALPGTGAIDVQHISCITGDPERVNADLQGSTEGSHLV